MAGEKDVLGKADALLRRHSASPVGDTASVPVLTDLVGEGAARGPADELAREVRSEERRVGKECRL